MRTLLIGAISLLMPGIAFAGDPPAVTSQSRTIQITPNLSVGAESRTIYTQPNNTGGQTQQSTERGSSANTSYGATVQYRFK
jgi:hypothetical protein